MLAPEILHHLSQQFRLFGDELRVEQATAFKRMLLQHPIAETVNGVNGRFVKVADGFIKRVAGFFRVLIFFDVARQKLIVAPPGQEILFCSEQSGSNPLFEFVGGCFGEGDDENLVHLEILLEKQPQVQTRDGVGFPGAGTCLDEIPSRNLAFDVFEFLRFSHR